MRSGVFFGSRNLKVAILTTYDPVHFDMRNTEQYEFFINEKIQVGPLCSTKDRRHNYAGYALEELNPFKNDARI